MRTGVFKIAIMIWLFCAAIGSPVFAANPPASSVVVAAQPALKSTAVLVMDEGSESVLYQQHADVAVPIASITKLMTALVVLEAGQPMDEVLQITAADRDTERGSTSRLAIGTRLTRAEMMHLALMASENRTAHALGRNYPGGLAAMIQAMNAKARALGMQRTTFVDPTGLSSRNVASPQDLSRLVIAAARNPTISQYSTDQVLMVKVGRQRLEFRNTNSLVAKPDWDIAVQKTGYISEAGKCLVMKAMIAGRSVVIVLLDSYGKYTRVADAKRIKTWMESQTLTAAAAL